MTEEKKTEKQTHKRLSKSGRIITNVILVAALLVAAFSGYQLVKAYVEYQQSVSNYDSLKQQAEEPASTASAAAGATTTVMNWEYLKSINADTAGWISLSGSTIDYPIVYSTDNEYYLTHLFDGTANSSGAVFIDYRNSQGFTDKNTVLYGHHMKNGTMFADVENYKDASYYADHKTITIDTPTALYEMYPVAGIVTTGTDNYVQFSFSSNEAYLSYVDYFVSNSTFTSDVTIGADDQMVTLSTCSYDLADGRYALIGKLVKVKDYE